MKECIVCKNEPSFKCAQCRKAYYCSRECQSSDWEDHSISCSIAGRYDSAIIDANIIKTLIPDLFSRDVTGLKLFLDEWGEEIEELGEDFDIFNTLTRSEKDKLTGWKALWAYRKWGYTTPEGYYEKTSTSDIQDYTDLLFRLLQKIYTGDVIYDIDIPGKFKIQTNFQKAHPNITTPHVLLLRRFATEPNMMTFLSSLAAVDLSIQSHTFLFMTLVIAARQFRLIVEKKFEEAWAMGQLYRLLYNEFFGDIMENPEAISTYSWKRLRRRVERRYTDEIRWRLQQ